MQTHLTLFFPSCWCEASQQLLSCYTFSPAPSKAVGRDGDVKV